MNSGNNNDHKRFALVQTISENGIYFKPGTHRASCVTSQNLHWIEDLQRNFTAHNQWTQGRNCRKGYPYKWNVCPGLQTTKNLQFNQIWIDPKTNNYQNLYHKNLCRNTCIFCRCSNQCRGSGRRNQNNDECSQDHLPLWHCPIHLTGQPHQRC